MNKILSIRTLFHVTLYLQDVTDLSIQDQGGEKCNKDTGSKQCLQRRIRGVFLIISGGGIIRKFAPLYTSESPAQAAFILISFLPNILKDVPKECWSDLVLAYDKKLQIPKIF